MRLRIRQGLFSPKGQIRLMNSLFKKARVEKKFDPAKDDSPEKIWMRKGLERESYKLVRAKIFAGVDPKLKVLIWKLDAEALVRELAKRKYNSTSSESLAKAKQDAIRTCNKIFAKTQEMCKANLEIMKLSKHFIENPPKTDKERERFIIIANAKDGFGSSLNVGINNLDTILIKLRKLVY